MPSPDAFDLLSAEVIEDPYPFFACLREQAPVHPIADTGIYLVSTRALIEEVLEREQEFSANLTGVLMTGDDERPAVFDLTKFGSVVDAIANADEPTHAIHRKLVLPHVTPRGIAALEATIRSWAAERIQPLVDRGAGDWVAQVANPVPTLAMCAVVGLPFEDADSLLEWGLTGTQILAGVTTLARMIEVGAKTGEMAAYLEDQLKRALASPPGEPVAGILGELARGVRDGLIESRDAVSILVVLVGAAAESTSSWTGNTARVLAEQPALQSELRDDPSLIPAFAEEVVRLEAPFRGHYRAVRRTTELGGVRLPEGSRVLLLWAAANREPAQFEAPDALDLRRPNVREHLSFGRGTHFCVGARLARLEIRVILEELLARTRDFALDPEDPPRRVASIFVRRHERLGLRLRGR